MKPVLKSAHRNINILSNNLCSLEYISQKYTHNACPGSAKHKLHPANLLTNHDEVALEGLQGWELQSLWCLWEVALLPGPANDEEMVTRRCFVDRSRMHCVNNKESTKHLLSLCPFAQSVWKSCKLHHLIKIKGLECILCKEFRRSRAAVCYGLWQTFETLEPIIVFSMLPIPSRYLCYNPKRVGRNQAANARPD